jgi:ferric-dicitrate binding protein FerR (iron transport regulator)
MSSPDTRTASSSPLTPASYLADENAFRRAFDLEFHGAMADARARLGEAVSLAPRVVETAFVNAWQQRANLTAHEQFKQVLQDEVTHGAARALSRRAAAHRFGGASARDESTMTGTHPATSDADPETAWSRIVRTIHGEGHTAEAHRAAASATRHDAAAHMKDVAKRPSWLVPAIIGVVALAASIAGVMYVDRLGEDDAAYAAVSSPSIQPISSSPGQIGTTTLGDGSKMRMGPVTRIFIADGFATKMRALRVEGTAAFDVARDSKLPFRVIARKTLVTATGTKFVISTFAGDSVVDVLVREGTVTVKGAKGMKMTVNANQAVVSDTSGVRPAKPDERADAFNWVDGHITMQHRQLRYIVDALTRWFNWDVKVPDLPLLDRDASIDVPLDSGRLAVSQVEQSATVRFAYEGETKVFRDAKGAAPAAAKPGAKPAAKPATKGGKKKR